MYTDLISVEQLQTLIDRNAPPPMIFDVRFDLAAPQSGREQYAAGHLPGAQYLHLDDDLSGVRSGQNGRHPLPDRQRLADTLGALGLSSHRQRQVVIHDDHGGMFAARAWWVLRWLGYTPVAVLNGGLQAWLAQGQRLETHVGTPSPALFVPTPGLVSTVDVAQVEASLASDESVLIDARSPDRFRGENETIDPVGGHIPGALNRFFKDNLQPDGFFKPAHTLRAEFDALLGTRTGTPVVQCGSGVTACHHVLAMAVAHLATPALYAGSWSEWVADPRRPIETDTGAHRG